MVRWTERNTEGFTADELATLNDTHERLDAAHPDVDEMTIDDMINNAWIPGATVSDLVAAVTARLNKTIN